MKNVLFLISLFISVNIFAQTVTLSEAEQVAQNFYRELYKIKNKKTLESIQLSTTSNTLKSGQVKSLYVFNNEKDAGFVIVAGNKLVYPVLAYSLSGNFDENEMPPAVKDWLEGYKKQIESIDNFKQLSDNKNLMAWEKYSDSNFDTKYLSSALNTLKSDVAMDVPPLISTTWNQGNYYNALCPECSSGGSGGHVWAGCVATAQAQLMKYYDYPEHGVGEHSYTHSVYGLQSVDFENTTYNWSNMPLALSSHNNDVATLLYHCGVSVNMNYAPDGSGASSSSARTSLVNYFKYSSNALYTRKGNYTDENWKNLLKTEIDAGRPMYYVGYGSGGHAFNCDGYQGDDFFHFNWGWGGAYNGYFYLNDLTPGGSNFTDSQGAMVGAVPEPMEADLDSISAIVLSCGTPYNGTTTDGENIVNQYVGSYWHNTGKEKIHKITTTYSGRITATLTNLNSNNLDVFILKYADRKSLLAAGDSVSFADNCEAGTYYIIVDGRYGTSGTYTLNVKCPDNQADLIIYDAKVNPNTVIPGGKINVVATVENIGNSVAPENVLKYYVSDDQTYSGDDIYVDSIIVNELNVHNNLQVNSLLTLPGNVTDGSKYLILKIDANSDVAETDEDLNHASTYIQVAKAGIIDCSSAIALQDGVSYQGNSSLYGEANISDYNWFFGLDNKEVIHSFTTQYSGLVDLEFVESLDGDMNLILLGGCNENACVNSFGLYHTTSDTLHQSFYVVGGINYYLVVDGNNQMGEAEGAYSIKITLPDECPTPVVSYSSIDRCIGDGPAYLYTNWEYSSFQWLKDGVELAGENSQSLSVSENGVYQVNVVENGCTGSSAGIEVAYSPKPTSASISAVSDTVFCEGSSVILELATGAGYTYQWTRDNELLPLANSLSYEASKSGKYKALVTNESCTITSNPIEVIVKHSACENDEPLPISTDSLITFWAFDSWGTDESGYGNYAGISGAYQCKDKEDNYSAFSFDGVDDYIFSSKQFEHPDTFTVAVWFKSNTSGPVVCFDEQKYVAASSNIDRIIYLDNNGYVRCGVDNGSKQTISSTNNYADDQWHLAVVSLSPQGMKLYLDGVLNNQLITVTTGKSFSGYWKVANGDLTDWPQAGNHFFAGKIDDIRIYKRALNADEVETLFETQLINITLKDEIICASSGNTDIEIENSEPGVDYLLMNNATSLPIGAAVEGNAGTILLPTGTLTANTQIRIKAENINTSCINEFDSVYNIAVGAGVVPEVHITSDATLQEFCKGDTIWFNKTSLYGGDTPVYNWRINGQSIDFHNEILYTTELEDLDKVTLEMVSSIVCANPGTVISNEIIANINPLPEIHLGADTTLHTNESLLLDAGQGYQSYEWSTGDFGQLITIDGNIGVGEYSYYVLVGDINNCFNSDTINITISLALGINDFGNDIDLKFYPNPVKDWLNIEINNLPDESLLIEVINSNGQCVNNYRLKRNPINFKEKVWMGGLPKGIYYLNIKTNGLFKTVALVVD
ncbi:MAG: C10 family peptidase [Bacteroidales bacterium]|nr:C10 family peptidase [Bacteroidales bacterium]